MKRAVGITAVAALVVLTSAGAHAQGWWYNDAAPSEPDSAGTPSQPSHGSYSGFYTSPDGATYFGTVNSFSMNLGGGMSMGFVTSVSNGSGELPWLSGRNLAPGFAGMEAANDTNGWYLDPAAAMPANVSGRMSLNLGGGLSMDFLGGLSNGPGNGFYYGPRSGFGNGTTTSVGTGFSMNFGHGGTLSVAGSVSRSSGFAMNPCGDLPVAACR